MKQPSEYTTAAIVATDTTGSKTILEVGLVVLNLYSKLVVVLINGSYSNGSIYLKRNLILASYDQFLLPKKNVIFTNKFLLKMLFYIKNK